MRYSFAALCAIALLVASPHTFAEDNPFLKSATPIETAACPAVDMEDLRDNLCMAVGDWEKDPAPLPRHPWMFQRMILEASCADPYNDPPEVIAQKVQKFWKREHAKLHCSSIQFDVTRGSVLKFAVSKNLDAFINSAAKWGIGLEEIDPSDGRTLLDYLKVQIERSNGGARAEQHYFDTLRAAGAKYASELN